MRSKDVLKQALMDYDGALIVVSHDRDFLQGLTGKVVEFRGGNIKEFAGDIYEFLRLKNMDTLRELEATKKTSSDEKRAANAEESQATKQTSQAAPIAEAPTAPAVKPIATTTAPTSNGTPAPTLDREERKRLQREERKLAKQIEDCEAQISKLEKEIAETETAMQSQDFYAAPNVQTVLTAHDAKRKELDAKVEEWSALSAEREELLALGV
jgi:ATP-binding cassette subfamily F protein 3